MKLTALIALTGTYAIAATPIFKVPCAWLPGKPSIQSARPVNCYMQGNTSAISLRAPAQIVWQDFRIAEGKTVQIYTPFRTINSPAGNGSVQINGTFTSTAPTLITSPNFGTTITVGERGIVSAPEVTLSSLRLANPSRWLNGGSGQFTLDKISSETQRPYSDITIAGLVNASGAHASIQGNRILIARTGEVTALYGNVRIQAGTDALLNTNGTEKYTDAPKVRPADTLSPTIDHRGRIHGSHVRLTSVPVLDSSVANYTIKVTGSIQANMGVPTLDSSKRHSVEISVPHPGWDIRALSADPIVSLGPIDDETPLTPPPSRFTPASGNPLRPISISTGRLTSLGTDSAQARTAPQIATLPAASTNLASRGPANTQPVAKKKKEAPLANGVTTGRFFGLSLSTAPQ